MNPEAALKIPLSTEALVEKALKLTTPACDRSLEWLEGGLARVQWRGGNVDEFMAVLAVIKTIPGREYHSNKKFWTVPTSDLALELLRRLQFKLKDGSHELIVPKESEEELPPLPWLSERVNAKLLHPDVRHYQLEFIKAMKHWGGRGLNGDEMGTGKTCQALSWVRYCAAQREDGKLRTIVATLASTKTQWRREWKKWVGSGRIVELYGKTPRRLDPRVDCYVINWDILDAWKSELLAWNPDYIVGDEIHLIGNPSAKRTKAFRKVAQSTPMFVGLTGTPIRTRPAQFWTILNLVSPETFPDHRKFLYRYCQPKPGFGGKLEFKGSSNEAELHRKIRPLMIRRLKRDVLTELPEKIRSVVPIEVSQSFRDAEEDALANLPGTVAAAQRAIEALSNSVFDEKAPSILRWLGEFLESERKIVVFAWHRAVVEFLCTQLGKAAVRIDGSCGQVEKDAAVKAFRTQESIRVLVGNIAAAGTGIDGLQDVCSDVAFVELAWSPADMNQAEDRLHRLGQGNPVTIHYLIGEGTIEEDHLEILQSRWGAMGAILDGQAAATDLYQELINLRRTRRHGQA